MYHMTPAESQQSGRRLSPHQMPIRRAIHAKSLSQPTR